MRVAYDGYIYTLQRHGGVNRIFEETVRRLPSDWRPEMWLRPGAVFPADAHAGLKLRSYGSAALLRWSVFEKLAARNYAARFARSRPDICHPTYYEVCSREPASALPGPMVLTVYDFIVQRMPHIFSTASDLIAIQRAAIEAADRIICISESTLRDLEEFYPGRASRATVVPLASGLEPRDAILSPEPPAPYFLFVGSRTGYKNFHLTLHALAALSGEAGEIPLVVIGQKRLDRHEMALIDSLGLEGRVRFERCDDDNRLAGWYRESLALLYPSSYEGFGIPVLEAMQCGTVAIAARATSIPEVAGDAAILVPAEDVAALAEAMQQVADQPALRSRLIEAGHRQAARFHWDRTARETVAVYESMGR